MPIEIAGEDDMVPPERRRVRKQLGVVERAGPRKVAGRFVHVDRVPERDSCNDEVERHGPFLLRIPEHPAGHSDNIRPPKPGYLATLV